MLKKRTMNWQMLPVILALAWPTMLEQLMQTAVQYIDTGMVAALGTQATAAVGATSTVNWLVGSTISALAVGFLALISRAYGAEDFVQTKKASAQAVLGVLALGSLFTLLTLGLSSQVPVWMQVEAPLQAMAARYFFILYLPMLPRTATIIFGTVLRSVGDTKTPMVVGVLVNICNVILNFFFIYPTRLVEIFGRSCWLPGCGWGVEGAAAASAVAFTLGGICITVAYWRHKVVSPKGQSFCPDGAILKPCLKIALPNMLQRFGTSLGYVVFASMINAFGEVATAAHTIANTVESAFYIPGYGMQMAAATLTGQAYGAKDRQKMKDVAATFLPLEVTLMVVSGGLLFWLAPQMMDLFSDNAQVIAQGALVLRMVAVTEPFYGVTIIIQGLMQGVGDTKTAFVYDVFGMWSVRILGTFLCATVLELGFVSAWGCMILHNMLLFVLFLRYYRKGRWNPLEKKVM